jgi:maleylacetate reductase
MVIAGAGEREIAERVTGGLPVVHRHDDVVMHVPVEVAERAREAAAEHDADVLVSVGGGSTTGLAKAVALTTGLPIVAVPTTYAGSEATPVWGLTEGAARPPAVDRKVLPRAIVYDASLTLTLPAEMSVASGLNAAGALRRLAVGPPDRPDQPGPRRRGHPGAPHRTAPGRRGPDGLPGREQALYGAYLSAWPSRPPDRGCTTRSATCSAACSTCRTPRPTPSSCPHVLAFNGTAAPEAEKRLADAFGTPTAREGLARLRDQLDAPRSLRDLGMPSGGIASAAEAVVAAAPAGNPSPVTLQAITGLVRTAWEGAEPR